MNVHESEKLAGILDARGYLETNERQEADILVINTCCIRENAENRVLGNLGYIKKLKENKRGLIVAVCGCMTQQKDAAQRIKARCPFVDIIFGTHNFFMFGEYLDAAEKGKKVLDILETEGDTIEGMRVKRAHGVNAWVNIMYGCDNYCAYCVVPLVRGRERSRKPEAILEEVEKLLDSGYKEITLLGQNVNSYCSEDKFGRKVDFARLLERAASFNQKYRLRFTTSHPKDFTDDVIQVIAHNPNIPEFIHLPAQSGSDRILALMNRKYTSKQYLSRIDTIRKYMPDVGLSSDIMVGFPTETESDFLDTLRLIQEVRYHNLYTFIFSPRKETAAYAMEGQIERAIADERFARLIEVQTKIGLELTEGLIGKSFEVLCDTYLEKTGVSRGKTRAGRIISFKTHADLTGQFLDVEVTHNKNTNLFGQVKK